MSDNGQKQSLKRNQLKSESPWSHGKLLSQHKTTTPTTIPIRQIFEYDDSLDEHMENYNVEKTALYRKLQSKMEALRILRKELDKFRTERDQFKLMAETLQLRYAALRRNSINDCDESQYSDGVLTISDDSKSSVAKILSETRERNIKLTTEIETLKQKLAEVQGDIEILRINKQYTKQLVNNNKKGNTYGENQIEKNALYNWKAERSNFIYNLEQLKKKNAQLAFDLRTVLDEKEEIINERDAYKCKTHRLNHELLSALKATNIHPKFIDIDSIILENKYLHERLSNIESEMQMAKKSINKYKKALLESRHLKSIIKSRDTSNSDENILTHKQVKTLLENGIKLPTKTETIEDLKSLCITLLDNLNDKNLVLNHQKKTNKVLAAKISEQERRLQLLSGMHHSSEGFSVSKYLLQDYNELFAGANDTLQKEEKPQKIVNVENDICSIHTSSSSPEQNIECPINECETVDESRTMSSESEDINDLRQPYECHLGDAGSSYSTESERSTLSSEYDAINNINDIDKDDTDLQIINANFVSYKISSASGSQKSNGTDCMGQSILKERNDDLKDLPPELAALVQKALSELDLRDFDDIVENSYENINVKDGADCNITINNKDPSSSTNKMECSNRKASKSNTY